MKWTALAALAIAIPTAANADFISNRAAWDKMLPASQATYAMGVVDSLTAAYADDTKQESAVVNGFRQCLFNQKIDGNSVATLVSEGYASDAANFSIPPRMVVQNQLAKVCRRYVSDERVKLGLPPL